MNTVAIRLPLRIRTCEESFMIEDASERLILCVYFDEGCEVRRQVCRRLTREEALACAKSAARAITADTERRKGAPAEAGAP